jgi:hypothetical protein
MESGQASLALKRALCLLTTTRRECVIVLTNRILNRILAITRVIALVPGHIIGYVVASFTFIPFALSIYVSIRPAQALWHRYGEGERKSFSYGAKNRYAIDCVSHL